jgi:hypothetical protein
LDFIFEDIHNSLPIASAETWQGKIGGAENLLAPRELCDTFLQVI